MAAMPDQHCSVCGGALVPPEMLPTPARPATPERPDYVCMECLRVYYWRGTPPQLIMGE